jgi:hypothetical protein
MKRRGSAFGHVQAEYRLENIFRRAAKEFKEADEARERIEKEYRSKKAPESTAMLPKFFSSQERRTEAGVILLMAAGAYLEQITNDYAYTFLDADSYDEHLGNVRAVTKWMLLPRLCQNKEISEDEPAINAFREFVKARNAVVHHKRKDFDLGLKKAQNQVSTEIARFLSACRKAETTVDDLIKILTSPPPGAKEPDSVNKDA